MDLLFLNSIPMDAVMLLRYTKAALPWGPSAWQPLFRKQQQAQISTKAEATISVRVVTWRACQEMKSTVLTPSSS